MAIIKSLLDNDLYKISMQQAVLHKFPSIWMKYKFKCRNEGILWTEKMAEQIQIEINKYCELKFTPKEIAWLASLRYIKKDFIEFLRIYQPQVRHVKVIFNEIAKNPLEVIVEGPWFLTILFEVPILAIINEVYFDNAVLQPLGDIGPMDLLTFFDGGRDRLNHKIEIAKKEKFLFSDFGTRRRFSAEWQDQVVGALADALPRNIFGGTSNMMLAMKYDLTPIGTMAHEFIMAGQALEGVTLAGSQKYMLQAWVDEYRGDLGTALTDTLGIDKFLRDFDLYFSKLYDGVRHDSGNPFEWGQKMIAHYEAMKIDPRTKQFIWSDGLDFEKATALNIKFGTKARCSFGIGTNLTCDMPDIKPLNIVMKIVTANGKPVAKISDSPSKGMCEDTDFLSYLQKVIKE